MTLEVRAVRQEMVLSLKTRIREIKMSSFMAAPRRAEQPRRAKRLIVIKCLKKVSRFFFKEQA